MLSVKDSAATKQLYSIYQVLFSSIDNNTLLSILRNYGFTPERIEQGKDYYEAAVIAVGTHIVTEEHYGDIEGQVQRTERKLKDSYLCFLQIAHDCLGKESIQKLGIDKKANHSDPAWCENAKVVFGNISFHEDIKRHLEKHGFSLGLLEEMYRLIDECFELQDQLDKAKHACQCALDKKNRRMSFLRDWFNPLLITLNTIRKEHSGVIEFDKFDKSEFFAVLDNKSIE